MKKTILAIGVFVAQLGVAQITNQDLVEMKKQGFSESIIKTKIATEDSNFDVSTEGILFMKNNGFSDEVVELMMQKNQALKAYGDRLGKQENNEAEAVIAKYMIENKGESFVVGGKKEFRKGDDLQIYLPASGKEFMFVEQQKTGLTAKFVGKVAEMVGAGATGVILGSGNVGTMRKAWEVARKAETVRYGANAINDIQNLGISKTAKTIAGKVMKVEDWGFDDDGWFVNASLDKKKYKIRIVEALMTNEVQLEKISK